MFNMRGQLPEHEVRSLMLQLLGALRYARRGAMARPWDWNEAMALSMATAQRGGP